MDLSVIIVSYNTKELLFDCLSSVNKITQRRQVEVFVVDNHSQDGTVSALREKFPKFHTIANRQNLGFSKANNQALVKARGKYILILNPDTRLMSDTVDKMIDFMNKNQDIAIATCRVELLDGRLDRDCRRHFPTPWRAFCHFSGLEKLFPKSRVFDQYYMNYRNLDQEHEIDSCGGAFMMIREKALKQVGFFDEDYFFYGEDLDLCYRFKEKGLKIVYTPITKIIHYKGAASGMKSTSAHITKATKESKRRALLESTRAMRLFYQKHLSQKYPFFINLLIYIAIFLIEKFRLLKA